MKKTIFLIILTALFMFPSQSFCKTKLLKFALLAPEGSTWSKVMHSFDKELRKKTSGRVGFKFYEGAILGDERDVIRKMRIGQVHAAGFTGLGLGLINPNVRVLELPMLVETYAEADAVRNKLKAQLETGFLKKGFEMLGWSETGFVYILSNKPISSRKDMSGVKMWAWEGDQLVETLYKASNIVPIPTSITEVLTSLQTHLIDGVYAPPLAAIALQWYTQTKYMTDLKLSDSTGGVLVTKGL